MELLGTVDRRYPALHSYLRNPPPPAPPLSLATPSPQDGKLKHKYHLTSGLSACLNFLGRYKECSGYTHKYLQRLTQKMLVHWL
jgi:hypothetical protein